VFNSMALSQRPAAAADFWAGPRWTCCRSLSPCFGANATPLRDSSRAIDSKCGYECPCRRRFQWCHRGCGSPRRCEKAIGPDASTECDPWPGQVVVARRRPRTCSSTSRDQNAAAPRSARRCAAFDAPSALPTPAFYWSDPALMLSRELECLPALQGQAIGHCL